ncbi:MAG: hypothetical protein M0D55_12355 [Elusimicrobiota bacterium]|nr:MAG: hypothetical protein M0D55_12355 [Elusimicrobiota bacterium]
MPAARLLNEPGHLKGEHREHAGHEVEQEAAEKGEDERAQPGAAGADRDVDRDGRQARTDEDARQAPDVGRARGLGEDELGAGRGDQDGALGPLEGAGLGREELGARVAAGDLEADEIPSLAAPSAAEPSGLGRRA